MSHGSTRLRTRKSPGGKQVAKAAGRRRAVGGAARSALVLTMASLLFGTMTLSAHAARGEFEYLRADNNTPDTISDPPNGCRTLNGGAANASNRTDTVATVYRFSDCRDSGRIATVPARGGTWNGVPTLTVAHGVRFG
ncbi:hypothetical protein [Streptomyces buecherae]|uniref:hypothetical protein n=1 Tax=Streptomyces buecherae TaxID=2763006 RepID=UPI0036B69520